MECPGCKTVLVLVPHGNGRYAPPGEPPPPPPTEAERRLPWMRDAAAIGSGTAAPPRPVAEPAPTPPAPAVAPAAVEERRRAAPGPEEETPLVDPFEACEILGVSSGANAAAIESAYRERALLCHPDKVAHLDADIQAVAQRKFRRLQEARDLLLG
jgi:DnaJ-domain-containing protein 1